MCHKPWYSSVRVLPKNIKNDILNHYEVWKQKNNFKDEKISTRSHAILDSISKYMLAKDEENKLENFVTYTKELDILRNQNILNIVPQYEELFCDN